MPVPYGVPTEPPEASLIAVVSPLQRMVPELSDRLPVKVNTLDEPPTKSEFRVSVLV